VQAEAGELERVPPVTAGAVEQVGAGPQPQEFDDAFGLPGAGFGVGQLRVRPQVQLVEERVPCAPGVMLWVADSKRV